MNVIKSFEDLEIYKLSYKLALEIHERTKTFPETERYDLTSQIRRASKSAATNIAEGYGRQSRDEFKRFAKISLGSCNEMQVHLTFCKDLGYMKQEEYEKYKEEYIKLGKMLNVSIQKWK